MASGPFGHGPALSLPPHEQTVDRAVIAPVGHSVAGGDHVIEAEGLCKRANHVDRCGGGDHELASGRAVLLEQRLGEGRYRIGERLGRHRGSLVHQIEVPTLGKASALAAQEHGGPGFTNGVEDLKTTDSSGLGSARSSRRGAGPR